MRFVHSPCTVNSEGVSWTLFSMTYCIQLAANLGVGDPTAWEQVSGKPLPNGVSESGQTRGFSSGPFNERKIVVLRSEPHAKPLGRGRLRATVADSVLQSAGTEWPLAFSAEPRIDTPEDQYW